MLVIDILPTLKGEDSLCRTLMLERERLQIHSLIPSPALPFGLLSEIDPQHEQVWVV